MTTVAFDTSTPCTTVAVQVGDEVLERRLEPPPDSVPAHCSQLLGTLAGLLAEAGCEWTQVGRIGVGAGPGTFTGLRIASATAEGLRRSTGAEVVPVGSLEALALPAREAHPDLPVCAVIDARRAELFAAGWGPDGEPAFGPVALGQEEAEAKLHPATGNWLVVGDVPAPFDSLIDRLGVQRPAPSNPLNRIGGAALCRLADEGVPAPGPALPEYVREPDARRPGA